MKKKLRGIKPSTFQLDFDLYRVKVPIAGLARADLSVIDLRPEGVEATIMFVHGYAGCGETWEHQINHFAREFRVVVPDLRGHGQSDAPYSQYTMDELVADLLTVADELKLPERFVLVGHSFGGSVCVEFANAHPERLEKLVLIATAGEYPLARAIRWLRRVPITPLVPLWKYRPRWNAELHVMKRMLFNNLRKWQGWSLMERISAPTLIITGERDTYFPRRVFDQVIEKMPAAEVQDVGKAKHKVQLERHQAVNRALERFIKDEQRSSWRERGEHSDLLQRRPWLTSYGDDTPHTIPIPRQPLHRFLESAAAWVPKRKALTFYGHSLTYAELDHQVNQFAHALRGLGVRPGDRVMIILPNMPAWIIAYYATLKLGAVVVVTNPDSGIGHVVQQARQTEIRALITLDAFSQLAAAIQSQFEIHATIFATLDGTEAAQLLAKLLPAGGASDADGAAQVSANGHSMAELMRDTPIEAPQADVSWESTAVVIFTSGTTEAPKGVCLTHSNLVANAMQMRHWMRRDLQFGREVLLSVLPFFHSYGMTVALNLPVAMGATMVLLPTFELKQVLDHIKTYKPTLFPGMPGMYAAINNAPNVREYGVGSIKACMSGGAPLPIEVQESFEKLTRGCLVEGYGLTEAGPGTHANPLHGARKIGTIGLPLPNTDARIVDLESGAELPPGQIGELLVKGPQVMAGYWGETEADERESVIKEGWLHTGDVAVMDVDGFFQIINRKPDAIRSGGQLIFPRDVEEVLYENNKVMEATVVGIGDAAGNQRIKAFVVARPGAELSEQELLQLCRRRLEERAVPEAIVFREALPKSSVGKVLRRVLAAEEMLD